MTVNLCLHNTALRPISFENPLFSTKLTQNSFELSKKCLTNYEIAGNFRIRGTKCTVEGSELTKSCHLTNEFRIKGTLDLWEAQNFPLMPFPLVSNCERK